MAKKTVIQDRVKIRGIRKRWLVNSMGVVTLILLLAMGTLTLSLWAYYEGSMRPRHQLRRFRAQRCPAR